MGEGVNIAGSLENLVAEVHSNQRYGVVASMTF